MHYMTLSGYEMVWLHNMVPHTPQEEYVEWYNANYYDNLVEVNMLMYGDLTRMSENSSYVPDISWKTEDEGMVSEPEREFYYATVDVFLLPSHPCKSANIKQLVGVEGALSNVSSPTTLQCHQLELRSE